MSGERAMVKVGLPKQIIEEAALTAAESRRLIAICVELIDVCAKVTGKFDPGMEAMIAYARDEALFGAFGVKV
jgi:hypothetical protein